MNLEKAIEQLKKQVSPLGEPASIEAISVILNTLKVQQIESELRSQKKPQFRVDVFDINTEHTKYYFDDISTALDFGKRVKQVVPSNVFILERSSDNLYDVIQEVSDITTKNNEEKEITIDVAKKAINDYYEKEFGKDSIVEDYSNLSKISLAYTNTEDEKHSIQSTADLSKFRINTFVDDKLVRQERFNNLRDMYNKALVNLSFNDLTYVSQDVIAELEQDEMNLENVKEYTMKVKQIKGLKKAVGDYKRANAEGRFSPRYGVLMFDKSDGNIWTDEFYDLGHGSFNHYHSKDIVSLSKMMLEDDVPITMETVKKYIKENFKDFNEKNENQEIAFLFDGTKIGERSQSFNDGYVIINARTKDEAVETFKAQYGRGQHNEALCTEVISDLNRVEQIKSSDLPCHNYIDLTKSQEQNQSNTEEQTDGRK